MAHASGSIFGKYDVRHVVGEGFNANTFYRLGRAWAQVLHNQLKSGELQKLNPVATGHDARTHAPELFDAWVQGLRDGGITVWTFGMVPTPLMYFAERLHELDSQIPEFCGVGVVTASHNPPQYNGLKLTYQTRPVIFEIYETLQETFWALPDDATLDATKASTPGDVHHVPNLTQRYIDYLKGQFNFQAPAGMKPLKVVLDAGNATAGVVAPALFRTLGCEVVSLFEEPDGTFPNHHPDPLVRKNLDFLCAAVKEHQADIGFAFDGDSDRMGMVDNTGEMVLQDLAYMLCAEPILKKYVAQGQSPVLIVDVKMSQVTFDWIAQLGGKPLMVKTGHVFSKRALRENNAMLAGELSGHHCFNDRFFGHDDGIYAAVRMAEVLWNRRLQEPAVTLTQMMAELPPSVLSDEIRIHCDKDLQARILDSLDTEVQGNPALFGPHVHSVNRTDGLRMNFNGGFVLIRSSNTEPDFTLRWEAPDRALFNGLEQRLMAVIQEWIAKLKTPASV